MRKIILTLLLIIPLSGCIGAGEVSSIEIPAQGKFPIVNGIDLTGMPRKLPSTFQGDLNIVILAFKQEQQEIVNQWFPFIKSLQNNFNGIEFYEIPVIYAANPAIRLWANNGMRSGITEEDLRQRTITVYLDKDKFLDAMQMNDDTIFTLLLDDFGNIKWRTDGAPTPEKQGQLEQVIREIS
ncbi:MAG: hypothetical protein AAF549_02530 [Pseudomonadota bacterium]